MYNMFSCVFVFVICVIFTDAGTLHLHLLPLFLYFVTGPGLFTVVTSMYLSSWEGL